MLYSNAMCKTAHDELNKTQLGITLNNLKTGGEYMIGSFFSLISQNPQVGIVFASEALTEFVQDDIADDNLWESNYNQLALYGFAMSGLFYVYDNEKCTLSLQTSSLSILEGLRTSDKIEIGAGKTISTEFDKWEKQLSVLPKGNIQKSLEDGSIIRTVKLELQPSGKYIVTVPRSCIKFEEQPIIPYSILEQELSSLVTLSSTQLLCVVSGDKVRYVTLNRDILEKVYDTKRVETLLRGFQRMQRGSSYLYLPSVGASKFTAGFTRVDLMYVDYIKGGSLKDVDLSGININYDNAKPFLIRYLKEQTVKDVARVLGIPKEVLLGKNVTQQKEYLTAMIMRTLDVDVYNAIIKLGISEKEYESFESPLGNCYTEVEIPSSAGALSTRLSTGVYKIVFVKRDGKFGTIIGTNCDKYLKASYGNNYMKKFESEGVRLRRLLHKVMSKDTVEVEQLLGMCDKLGLDTLKEELSTSFLLSFEVDSEAVVSIVSKYLEAVESRRTTKFNPDNVLIRNCFATVENGECNNYYRNIDFKTIKAIYKLTE